MLTPLELKSAIVRDPLVVSPNTMVTDAIAQMSGVEAFCNTSRTATGQLDDLRLIARSSCVLVVEDEQIVGVLTERDVVRLSAQQHPLDDLVMQQVMTSPLVTLRESAFTDLFSVINLLQQHHIRHLPILNERGHLAGLVTHESLRQISQPTNLLRLRQVAEVMTREVICASPDCSMLAIAQRIADHHISSVVIVEPDGGPTEPLQIPVGILTERDLVQFQALGLNLENCTAEAVMNTPLFAVKPQESLWAVQQIMEQRCIRRLVVTGEQGELLGIVTQSSLLQALNPLELYKLAEVLETEVARLKAEKVALLESRTVELERQVESRTAALKAKAEREKLVAQIAVQIRSSLSLQTILDTAVEQVRQVLSCDRVNIWRFEADGQSIVMAESTDSPLSLVGAQIDDAWLQQERAEIYRQGWIRVVSDIYTTEMSDGRREMLVRLQTRAKILAPLLCGDQLWGLLNATESQHPREWRPEDVELLQALSGQLAIALQQATIHQQLQAELSERQQSETRLQESEKRYATLAAAAPVGIFRTNAAGRCIYINDRWSQIAGLTPEAAFGKRWEQGLHPEERDRIAAEWYQSAQENRPFQLEYRFQRPDGKVTWVYGQSIAERDADGRVIGYVGTITDISARKQAEAERLRAEQIRNELTILEQILDITLAGYWDWDIPNHREYLSPGFKRMVGYAEHELPNTPESRQNLIFPEDLPKVLDCFDHHVQSRGQIPYYNEVRYRHKNGSTIWAICSGQVIEWDAAGNPLRMIGCHIDISDRKQIEIELKASRAYYQGIIADQTELICRFLPNGVLTFVNDAYCQFFQKSPEELLGHSFTPLLPNEDKDIALQNFNSLSIDNPVATCEHRVIAPDGAIRWQQWTDRALFDPDGAFIEFQAVGRDITALKEAEVALRESEARWQFALEGAGDGVWDWNAQTNTVFFSRQWKAMLGYPPDEVGNRLEDWDSRVHPDDKAQRDVDLNRHFKGETPICQNEHRIRCKDGGYKWILNRGKVIEWTAEGQPLRVIGTFTDISDRKKAEEQLRSLSDRLTLAVKSGAIGIWDWDVIKNVLTWDDRMYELYGVTTDQFTGIYDAWASRLHPDDRPMAEAAIQRALVGEKDYDIEFRVMHSDGSIHFIKASALVQRSDQGDPQRMVGISFDITNQKQAEVTIQQTAAQLATSNRELEAFAYSVSHDLRAPLRAIDGFSQALLEEYREIFDETGKDYFDRIRKNVTRMGLLINDLLSLSRVSRSEICYTQVNLSTLAQELMTDLQASEPERQVEVVIIPDAIVSADATLMRVVLTNLLSNAWKFTRRHSTARIEFGMLLPEDQPTYFVRDDGAGFNMAYAKKLFGVFQRLHTVHEFPGTGIGLATVQRVIHRHRGSVWGEGAVEQGATFYFTIPNTHSS